MFSAVLQDGKGKKLLVSKIITELLRSVYHTLLPRGEDYGKQKRNDFKNDPSPSGTSGGD
jgi:hypothetical protein